ncbi:MAG: Pre-mRNA-splicing factor [Sarcosagium campestre]|nr:MAG: Pre-mRNA-splicing factor [Sarcosagium campestre]
MAEVESSMSTAGLDSTTVESSPPAQDTSEVSPPPDTLALTTQDATATHSATTKPKKIIRRKRRPARPQVDPSTLKTGELPPQTGTIFNIWYNKWSGGDREDKYLSKQHAEGRCSIARDSGYTRADRVSGSYFCLFFARGLCPKGHECEYLHRLPGLHDLFNPNIDCFGRDKHSDYRDDMGGVGSFMRQNRTLYVGRIHVSDDIEEVVARHFAEWGQIDRTRVLTSRGVAFVTYTNEANGQFAKEAMAHQSLDHNEILNVRWATVDPNPLAAKREARKIDEQAAEAVRRALPDEFVREIEGRDDPQARKRNKIDRSYGLEGYQVPDELWYSRAVQNGGGGGGGDDETVDDGGDAAGIAVAAEALQRQDFETIGTLENTGLLGGSTLRALQGLKTQSNGSAGFTAKAASTAPSGPLVAYGSDEDESN